jgi:hypothetical protein
MNKLILDECFEEEAGDVYTNDEDGVIMKREWINHPETGQTINDLWVLRKNYEFVDYDRYRHDLAERHGYQIHYKEDQI